MTFSIPTLDEEVWRRTEPSTAHPRQRLRALRELVDAGIDARVGMAPILPGPLRPARAARATSCAPRARRARRASGRTSSSCSRGRASTSSRASRATGPSELPRYERLYANGRAYLPKEETQPVRAEVARLAREHGDSRPPARAARAARRSRSSSRWPCSRSPTRRDTIVRVPSEITCLIVDDHEVVREGLRLSLSRRRTSASSARRPTATPRSTSPSGAGRTS